MSRLILDELEALTGSQLELKSVCIGVDPTASNHVTTRGYEATQRSAHVSDTNNPHAVTAAQATTDTTNFTGNLSAADTNTQLALETLSGLTIIPTFSVGNSVTGLSQAITAGNNYDLLTSLLEATETQNGNTTIVYKNTSDVTQATFLDETNDKFLFPSNQNTFGLTYVPYIIRTVITVDYPSTSNTTIKGLIRLRRVVDDSVIATDEFVQSDFNLQSGVVLTSEIVTFVNSETDPFVVDGTYLDFFNETGSSGTVTINDVSIRIFRG